MPTLFGTSRWGRSRWGDTSSGHRLGAHGSIYISAYGIQLRHSHLLDVSGRIAIKAQVLGIGPAQIHPLSANGVILIVSQEPTLQLAHTLEALGRIEIKADEAPLRLFHKLSAEAEIDILGNSAFLSIRHKLAASGQIVIFAEATDLDLSHPLSATGRISIIAEGAYERFIPTPTPTDFTGIDPHTVIHGTVNLISNPTVEQNTANWIPLGSAIVDYGTDRGWHGSTNARTTVSVGGTGNGFEVRTIPMSIAPYPGSVLWGQIRLAGQNVDLTTRLRAVYSDGTVVDGNPESHTANKSGYEMGLPDDGWDWIICDPLTLDHTKTLVSASVRVIYNTGEIGLVWADGAMIEYDRWMYGPSLWIIGSTEAAVFAEVG